MANSLKLLFVVSVFLVAARTDSDKAAQKLLNSYDIEEITEKLLEFDLDQDGQLSEIEVELQQPGIQKYLDKYDQLVKAAEEEEDDEEDEPQDTKTPQTTKTKSKTETKTKTENENKKDTATKSSGKPDAKSQTLKPTTKSAESAQKMQRTEEKAVTPKSAAVEDEDDEDDGVEIEVVDEMEIVDDTGADEGFGLTSPVFLAGLVGVLSVILYAVCTVTRSANQVKKQQQEGER